MMNIQLLRYIYSKIKYCGKVRFHYSTVIGKNASFEGYNAIGSNSKFTGRMGRCSYMANDCDLYASIGRFTSIGNNVKSIMFRHPLTYPFVSTSPVFYSTAKQCGINFADREMFDECVMADEREHSAIVIGNDCWINSNVIFVSGVKVGDGAVVLAGAVVTRDVPPYTIVAGVPAKVINYRYEEDDRLWLMEHKWWNKDLAWLQSNWESFNDIAKFRTLMG